MCKHITKTTVHEVTPSTAPSLYGCTECLKQGTHWVHLRMCMECGHVGCCDNSPERHATKHFGATHHPIMRSFEPGEDWAYCYVDKAEVDIPQSFYNSFHSEGSE